MKNYTRFLQTLSYKKTVQTRWDELCFGRSHHYGNFKLLYEQLTQVVPLQCSQSEGGGVDAGKGINNICTKVGLYVADMEMAEICPVLCPVGEVAGDDFTS